MTEYTESMMVLPEHIIEIDKQLRKLGSKVKVSCLDDGEKHVLANVLYLACGDGTFGISLDAINSIKHDEFTINCTCRNHPTM